MLTGAIDRFTWDAPDPASAGNIDDGTLAKLLLYRREDTISSGTFKRLLLTHTANCFGAHGPRTGDIGLDYLAIEIIGSELVFERGNASAIYQPMNISRNTVDEGFADRREGNVAIWRTRNIGFALQFSWRGRGNVDGIDISSEARKGFDDSQPDTGEATLLSRWMFSH